ncbi:hypothetical protein FACS1894172_17350 [Spirochaetia bacterium]|nr:hypothetical protein FACS1894164_01700 [Spirochaetia bacterium]GHU35482.1 hypothetical protein FACS1894172_17350 [Spirochaetia bacterium]
MTHTARGATNLGLTYHVASEVNRRAYELEPVEDRKLFLAVIREAKTKKGFKFELWNFCIMSNHFHFLITPHEGQSLSEIMKWIKQVFAVRWNTKHQQTGHFWGDRFYSRVIQNELDFWNVYNYIDKNPVVAGLVENPEDWEYSGAYHLEHIITDILSPVTAVILEVFKWDGRYRSDLYSF